MWVWFVELLNTCQSTKGCLTSQSEYGVKLSDWQIIIMFIAIISHFQLF